MRSSWGCSRAEARSRSGVDALRRDEAGRGVDEGEVGEGLREVAEVLTRAGVDLLRVEVERPGERKELLEQLPGPGGLADHRERGDEPERADGERALLAAQAVVG